MNPFEFHRAKDAETTLAAITEHGKFDLPIMPDKLILG